METTSFALGMITVIVAGLLVIIGYTFYKVRKTWSRLTSVESGIIENLNSIRREMREKDSDILSALNNDVNALHSHIDRLHSHIDRQFDKRFDSFRKKLKTTCFEEDKEDTPLYS